MTLDEAINRLQVLREELGGDTPLVVSDEATPCGRASIFNRADIELVDCIHIKPYGDQEHWVELMDKNCDRVVWVY